MVKVWSFIRSISARNALLAYLIAGLFALPFLRLPNPAGTFLQTYPQIFMGFWILLYVLVGGVWAAVVYMKGDVSIRWSVVVGMLMVWGLTRLVSLPFSLVPIYSFTGAYGNPADGLVFSLALMAVAAIIISLNLSRKETWAVGGALLLQFLCISILTVRDAVVLGFPYLFARPNTILYNPDFFLSYAALLFPVAVWTLVKVWKGKKFLLSFLSLLTVGIALLAIFVALPENIQARIARLGFKNPDQNGILNSASNIERLEEWKIGLGTFRSHPITGSGAGTTREAFFEQAKHHPTWNYSVSMQNPHSEIIQELSQNGIPGLAAYLAFWVSLAALWFRRRKTTKDSEADALMAGLVLYFLFNQLLFPVPFVSLVFIVAVALLVSRQGYASTVKPEYAPLARVGYAVVVIVIGIGAWMSWQHLSAEQHALKVIAALNAKQGTTANSEADQAVSHYPWEAFYYDQKAYASLLSAQVNASPDTAANLRRQAVNASKKAVSLNPYSPYYLYTRGMVYFVYSRSGSGEEKSGLADFAKSYEIMPYNKQTVVRIIQALSAKPNNPDGLALLTAMHDQASNSMKKVIRSAAARFLPAWK